MRVLLPALCLILMMSNMILAEDGGSPMFDVISPQFSKLVPSGSKLERVASGFVFTEGPVWHRDGYLLFSDIPANAILKWEPNGKVTKFREPSGNSNGLTLDSKGSLIACEHGTRQVTRGGSAATAVLASHYDGKRLNSPNDVVARSDGSVYFTDPPYGVDEAHRELEYQGIFRLSPEGELWLLTTDMDRPNGLAFSPDEKRLYVADSSDRSHVTVYDVRADGSLTNGRVFAVLKGPEPGVPDGMKVDADGNLWCTGPGGVWVFDRSGRHLGTIRVPEVAANCAWGDAEGRTLYITATTSLYRVRTNATGIRRWISDRR